MELLKRPQGTKSYPERIIQFGEGNFLRGFVDYMVDVANEKGVFAGSVVVVKPIEYGSLDMFREQECTYTLIHRGTQNGKTIEDSRVITSISRVIDAYNEFDAYMDCAKNPDLRFVVSNTTEAGIVYVEADKLEDKPASSFPGKLTQFLYARYQHFKGDSTKGLIMIPCELIEKNGDNLKKCVLKQIENWKLDSSFKAWVEESCIFANTLVDRIVTGYPRSEADKICEKLGYKDNLIDTCEPFLFWAIESDKDFSCEFPMDKAGFDVVFTPDMTPYRERKVRILNGAHTSMVLGAYLGGKDIVRDCMNDPEIVDFMNGCIFEEIIPTLDLPQEELELFAGSVVERFNNPFIDHQLLSIALNSVSKFKSRILPTIEAYIKRTGQLPKRLVQSLANLLHFYKGEKTADGVLVGKRGDETYKILDDAHVMEFFHEQSVKLKSGEIDKAAFVRNVLGNTAFWGKDLNAIDGLADMIIQHM